MNYLSFPQVQDEVVLADFIPQNYLKDYALFFTKSVNLFTIEEKLLLLVLDRDGYFYASKKPNPKFLLRLWKFGIHFKGIKVFRADQSIYTCFLNRFMVENPDFKPTSILKNK